MTTFTPQNVAFEADVRASFAQQTFLATISATLTHLAPGAVDITLPFREDLTQQHGYLHAGVVTTIVDTACGYAAKTLMPANSTVLTVEYKVNFIAPAIGETMLARGRVTKPGRTLTVCQGDVFALQNGEERLVTTMLTTMMTILDRKIKA